MTDIHRGLVVYDENKVPWRVIGIRGQFVELENVKNGSRWAFLAYWFWRQFHVAS